MDLAVDVLRPLVEAGARIQTCLFEGYWEDVGEVATYHRAKLDLLRPEPRLQLHRAHPYNTLRHRGRPRLFAGHQPRAQVARQRQQLPSRQRGELRHHRR